MKRPALLLALALAISGAVEAEVNDLERFDLGTDCAPLVLIVEDLDPHAEKIGLARDAIRLAGESRLRAARIYNPEPYGTPYLYVRIGVGSVAHFVTVQLGKEVIDIATGLHGLADTWESGRYGTHGGGSDVILASLARILDRFIADYLRVNESACSP